MYIIMPKEGYKLYDITKEKFIQYFESKEDLILFLAKHYNWNYDFIIDGYAGRYLKETGTFHTNRILNLCGCNKNEKNKKYIIYDAYNKVVHPKTFESEAFSLFKRWKKRYHSEPLFFIIKDISKYSNYKEHKYEFRKDPVPRTRCWRGGRWAKPPKTIRIKRLYSIPEYKEFNRGTCSDLPIWWDDKPRRTQRSWKEQSKARHQWQRGKT